MGTMEYNCEHTRPVSRRSLATNNGYWYKDNKADGRIITMSMRVNGEGLTQFTVLLLQWGVERPRCQQYLLSQGQQGWGRNKLTIATRLSHHSKCQDALEWALESIVNPTTIISLSRKWDLFSTHGRLRPGTHDLWKLSVCLQHRRGDQSPRKWWSHLSFFNRDRTTSSRVSNQGSKENCSEPSLWHAPSRP